MPLAREFLIDRLGKRKDPYAWRNDQAPLAIHPGSRICLLHLDGRLGDAVINSVVASALERHHSTAKLTIGTTPSFVDYWSSHPFVEKAVVLLPTGNRGGFLRFNDLLKAARAYRGSFDVVVSFDPLVRVDTFSLLRTLSPRAIIGFSKQHYRLFDYSVADNQFEIEKEHITCRIERLLRLFGIESGYGSFGAHLPTTSESDALAEELLDGRSAHETSILFNTYGGGAAKGFSPESVLHILDLLVRRDELKVYLNVPNNSSPDDEFDRALHARYGNQLVVLNPARDLSVLFSLVRRMDGILTPDTGVGHVGAAMDKPLLCFFHDIGYGPTVWRPFSSDCTVLTSKNGVDVNDQDWATVPGAIDGFIERVRSRTRQTSARA